MPKYRLTYFNIRARGEVSRLLFAAAGVDYEDVRIATENWPSEKTSGKFPFGQMPILEVDGITIAQSYAIARFLANEFGFAGESNLDKAKVDMIADAIEDLGNAMGKMYFEKDEAKKAELYKDLVTKKIPSNLAALEKILTENRGGSGYLVGNKLTWADLAFLAHTDYYFGEPLKQAGLMNPHSKLIALRERLLVEPKLRRWLNTRPRTDI
ncbi:hematopoietic prostaglandin D synthase-like [Glandiceps talaboti]